MLLMGGGRKQISSMDNWTLKKNLEKIFCVFPCSTILYILILFIQFCYPLISVLQSKIRQRNKNDIYTWQRIIGSSSNKLQQHHVPLICDERYILEWAQLLLYTWTLQI